MDPVSAVANAIGTIFGTVGYGRRSEFDNQPDWLSHNDLRQGSQTTMLLIGGGVLIIIVIIIAIIFSKK